MSDQKLKSRYDKQFDDALKGVKSEWKQYCDGGNLDIVYVTTKCEQMIRMVKLIREYNQRLNL